MCCQDLDPLPDRPKTILTLESQVGLLDMWQLLASLDQEE